MPTYQGADGAELHYDVLGHSGPDVVVLAGGPARHPDYLQDLAGLDQAARLYVPHLRGVGRSSAAATGTAMDAGGERGSSWAQAEDVERLRVHLGGAPLLLLAHSAGTRLALSYAARFPDQVSGLVLLTPPATYLVQQPSDAHQIAARRSADPYFTAAWELLQQGPDTSDDDAFTAWQRAVAAASYARWGPREQAHSRLGRWNLQSATAFLATTPPADFVVRLRQVSAPVLVVAGAEDALTGLAPVQALAELFSRGRTVTLQACGHYPWVEQPGDFRDTVTSFLSGL